MLVVITAHDEEELAERMKEMQAIGKREGVVLETCDYTQLRAWNTALPIGGRQVDYMRFFLTSSLVAFQPFFAQDVIEPGGQMMGLNRTTKHFIVGNRKNCQTLMELSLDSPVLENQCLSSSQSCLRHCLRQMMIL